MLFQEIWDGIPDDITTTKRRRKLGAACKRLGCTRQAAATARRNPIVYHARRDMAAVTKQDFPPPSIRVTETRLLSIGAVASRTITSRIFYTVNGWTDRRTDTHQSTWITHSMRATPSDPTVHLGFYLVESNTSLVQYVGIILRWHYITKSRLLNPWEPLRRWGS